MNEKHQTIAIYAEIVSSVAVVITLIVLIFEVRGNTEIAKLEAYKGDLDRVISWREASIVSNPSNAKIYSEFYDGQFPDPESQPTEYFIFLSIIFNQWNMFESSFYSNEYGVLGEEEWSRMYAVMCGEYLILNRIPGMAEQMSRRVSPAFSSFIASNCYG